MRSYAVFMRLFARLSPFRALDADLRDAPMRLDAIDAEQRGELVDARPGGGGEVDPALDFALVVW